VGYLATAGLAVGFVFLGAAVLNTPDVTLPADMKAFQFAATLVDVYTTALGEWARPVILVAGFATMFSTTLSVLDGFPRALETAIARLGAPETAPAPRSWTYWASMAVCAFGGLGIIVWFAGSLTLLVDVATVTSFLTAPILAFLNLRAVTGAEVPEESRPQGALLVMHWVGLVLMTLFALAYCGYRLFVV
jgi:Mn2+/Fe2+ NRAMP family transporter